MSLSVIGAGYGRTGTLSLKSALEQLQASVDWPACHFYRELADYYPEAKVILTVRDPRTWYESIADTTLRVIKARVAENPESLNLGTELVVKAAFRGELDDPDHGVDFDIIFLADEPK